MTKVSKILACSVLLMCANIFARIASCSSPLCTQNLGLGQILVIQMVPCLQCNSTARSVLEATVILTLFITGQAPLLVDSETNINNSEARIDAAQQQRQWQTRFQNPESMAGVGIVIRASRGLLSYDSDSIYISGALPTVDTDLGEIPRHLLCQD